MAYTDVLVLGAGASTPYGFPTGAGLRNMILSEFGPLSLDSDVSLDEIIDLQEAMDQMEIDHELVERFHSEFRLSQTFSIDAFIERRARDFESIGKLSIAHCLSRCESEAALFDSEGWYQVLWNWLLPNGSIRIKELSIISFNYDRSLQHYLARAASAALGDRHQDGDEQRWVRIRPVHGSFARSETVFGTQGERELVDLANSITLPHEVRTSNNEGSFAYARDTLREAKRIFFLGFGFDETNTSRLFDDLDLSNEVEIAATSVGLGRRTKRLAQEKLRRQSLFIRPDGDAMSELIFERL